MRKNLKQSFLSKILLSTFVIFLCFNTINGQQKEFGPNNADEIPSAESKHLDTNLDTKPNTESVKPSTGKIENAQDAFVTVQTARAAEEFQEEKILYKFAEADIDINVKEKFAYKAPVKHFPDRHSPQTEKEEKVEKEKFHWKYALIESGVFLGFQHGFRMMQDKTRRELSGPFFRDWKQSVQNLRGWRDSDNLFTNYIAHPGQGAITGRIFINNSDRSKKQEFGKSKKYWESRLKAMTWSLVWSTQFELGPISEATLGNVGLRQKNGYSTMAYVDLVMTPVAGTGLLIAEDAVDKYFLRNWLEKKTDNRFVINISRSLFNPTTSIANMLRLKMPWYRRKR
jgi:hypothetical protein